ncbi:MAG TPA: DUF2809 domain-containing protein [Gemmatimonadaceae bacterium]
MTSSSIAARLRYVALAVATMIIGLAIHWRGDMLPSVARDKLGDALWAMMIAWLVAALIRSTRLLVRASIALAICFAVELSQMYHGPTLDAVRATTIGELVLGSGFDARDLAAYTAGVLAAVILERVATTVRR